MQTSLIIENAQESKAQESESIVELLSMPDVTDIDFEAPRLNGELYRPVVYKRA